jgi:FixJ family two-component response regulator
MITRSRHFASVAEYLAQSPYRGPACLMLDVRLPGLDGIALQRQLIEGGRMEQIVFITGHGDIPMGNPGNEAWCNRLSAQAV